MTTAYKVSETLTNGSATVTAAADGLFDGLTVEEITPHVVALANAF